MKAGAPASAPAANAALAVLTYVPKTDWHGRDHVHVTVSDDGASGYRAPAAPVASGLVYSHRHPCAPAPGAPKWFAPS